jgi:hypothetical protein
MAVEKIIEKRKRQSGLGETLKMLNSAQSFALGAFGECGAELAFVRETADGNMAVVKKDNHLVTIDPKGQVDEHPNIKVREKKTPD